MEVSVREKVVHKLALTTSYIVTVFPLLKATGEPSFPVIKNTRTHKADARREESGEN